MYRLTAGLRDRTEMCVVVVVTIIIVKIELCVARESTNQFTDYALERKAFDYQVSQSRFNRREGQHEDNLYFSSSTIK